MQTAFLFKNYFQIFIQYKIVLIKVDIFYRGSSEGGFFSQLSFQDNE
jgi:hypothetical protein